MIGSEESLRMTSGTLPSDLRECTETDTNRIEVIQEEGEIIFVPSDWYHQVFNEVR